jgi:hypothetical protein
MEDSPQRRRQRAYRLLREILHNTPKPEVIRILDEAGCFDHDPHIERQYGDTLKGYHEICRRTDDVQMDLIPLWKLEQNGNGTDHKVHYVGKFGEMDTDQHHQHLNARRDGIWADTGAFYHYLDRIENPSVKRAVQRRLEFDGPLPPRPPEPRPDDEPDDQ